MKLNYEYGNNSITVTKTYDPGEKYISAFRWDRSDGKATKEKVESKVPGCRFVGAHHYSGWAPDLGRATFTHVLVERIFGVEA